MPPKRKPAPPTKSSRKARPEERAREAMERDAETLAARAIGQEKNLSQLVEEILEAEAARTY